MYNIIAEIQFVEANNCFLHLSPNIFSKLDSSLSRCVKGLIVRTESVIYFSLNAEVCRKLSDSFVGLAPLYASSLGLSPGDKVILSPVDSTPSLSKLYTRPLSNDDHEILEITSAEVESSLLNQLRIVWANQCFPIWVSPTITVRLVVESIHPDVEVGRLEEHTELIIGEIKDSDRMIVKASEDLTTAQILPDESVIGETDIDSKCLPSEPFIGSVMLRLIPNDNIDFPPYHVTLSRFGCPDWLKSPEDGTVYQLSTCSEPFTKVYISVGFVASSTPDIGLYKTLNASLTVINHLSSSCGSKVLLSQIKDRPNELSSLLITPCPLLKKTYPLNEIENIFRKKLSTVCLKWGRCLLNTKGRFPLEDTASVSVTLRPLNLQWAQITLISLYNLPISVTSFEASVPDELNEKQSKCNGTSTVISSVIPDVNSLVEHSLGLKNGLVTNSLFKNNFLLVGKHGCGKTFILNNFLDVISRLPYYVHFEKVDCTTLKGKRIENIGKILSSHLNLCKLKQPSVILIEDIETICGTFSPELEKSEASFHIQRVSQKVANLLSSFSLEPCLLVFATCVSITSINSALFKRRGKSVFSTVLPIQPLTQEERKKLIEATILSKTLNSEDSLKNLNTDYFSSLTDSYVAGDLIKFIEKAIFEASQRFNSCQNELILIKDDLERAYESSSEFMHNKLKVQKHKDTKLSDVGGLKNVKEKLIEVVLWPSKFSSLLNQCPLRKQTGILLYGPPGSGKTLMARAIAYESNLNFIMVKGPELMSKYIGESEEGVRRVFENAQAAKPCLLFFDEFESLAPRRGEEQTGVTDRVVNQLLTALDGVEPISGVIVMAASSRPDLIDPALLRSGRLSHHLFCSYPNMEERTEILEKLTLSVTLDADIDLNIIAQRTEEFSGADLKGLLSTAQILVLDKLVDLNAAYESKSKSEGPVTLSQSDLLEALDQTQPSLSKKDRLLFANIYKMFSKGKAPDITNQRTIFA